VPPSRPDAGFCKGKPGSGPEDDVVYVGKKEIDTSRGTHEITYGKRQRQVVQLRNLPAAAARQTIGGEELHADAYADLPAVPSSCKGTTSEGYELRIVDVPMVNGGVAPVCIVFCRIEPPSTTSPPGRPAIETVTATPTIEPRRPAVTTVVATPVKEPQRRAVPTVVATPAKEPQRRAVPTVAAAPSGDTRRKAVPTLVAGSLVEPAKRAVPTIKASAVTEPAGPKR
jgi:hypothetical protein